MEALKTSDQEEAATSKQLGPIICVQLPEDILNEVQTLAESSPVQSFAFLDQTKVEELAPRAQALICTYDGAYGMARRFTPAIRAVERDLPIFLIVPPQFQNESVDEKRMDVSAAFKWPRDAARFSAAMYDLIHEEPDGEEPVREDGLSDFTLSEIARVDALTEIKPPARTSDHVILNEVSKEIERRKKHQGEMAELKELNQNYFIGRTIVFHPDPAGAEGLRRHLRSGGIPNSVALSSISEVFHHLRAETVACVVAWYDGEREDVLALVAEVNAARAMRPFALLIATPGETAMGRFVTQAKELIYDRVIVYEKSPSQFVKKVLVGVKQHRSEGSLSGTLFKLRSACRHAIPGSKRKPMDLDELTPLLETLRMTPGKSYWADAEEILQALLRRDNKLAADLSAKLDKKRLDAILMVATVKVVFEGGAAAGEWLIDKALNHRQLNLERCYIIARYLTRWRATKPLGSFLLEWYNREDLPIDHQFYFMLSGYFGLTNDTDRQLRFLGAAIMQSPLRDEYLYSLLSYFQAKRDTRREEDTWRVLLHAPGVNALAIRFHLAKVLIGLNKQVEARALLKDVLIAKPNFRPAQVLLQKVGDA